MAAMQLSRREPIANWRALLVRLASARAIDQLRQRCRSRIMYDVEAQLATVADSNDPGDTAQLNELQARLRLAIAQLSQDQATAFCLCALEGWTYAEASEQLQTPASTIGVLVHRARQRLGELLESVPPLHISTWSNP